MPGLDDPRSGISFVRLPEASAAQRDDARRIYGASFPARRRTPFEDVLAAGDGYSAELALLEYVAVDPALHGGGVGGRVWSRVCGGALAGGATGIMLEIEDPAEEGVAADERDTRLRWRLRLEWRRT